MAAYRSVVPLQNMMSRVAPGTALGRQSGPQRRVALVERGTAFELQFSLLTNTCKIQRRSYSNSNKVLKKLEKSTTHVKTEYFEPLPLYNEPILQYNSGSPERLALERELQVILNHVEIVPIVVNGDEIRSTFDKTQVLPFNIEKPIARYGHAHTQLIEHAIEKSVEAQKAWDSTSLGQRMEIWKEAADLIATKYRCKIMAATMLGQGKTVRQAEVDVAELVDFMRLNALFLRELMNYKPINNCPAAHRNYMRLRGFSGFVAAISPFNYTSIAGHLAYTPALMGNAVLWKPSDSAILSNWYVFEALRAAGVPDGVVNFVPAEETLFAKVCTRSSKLAGINFTGTAGVLKVLWQLVANNINAYENYPRLVGECGGKNFHFVHRSADIKTVVATTIRSAFEYAGQKCSSCSMLYVPESLWESKIKAALLKITSRLFVSDATYTDCFYSAVINKRAFQRICMYLHYIENDENCRVLIGGTSSQKRGYYVDPTIVQVTNLNDRICKEELLGPILCVYVYKDNELAEVMQTVAKINQGLTGSVFASDSQFIEEACEAFRLNVGNLNINDKCSGAMVGQQPFGGGQKTGTNDKMGNPHHLLRWTSPQAIKESFVPHVNIYYPHMEISDAVMRVTQIDDVPAADVNKNSDKSVVG